MKFAKQIDAMLRAVCLSTCASVCCNVHPCMAQPNQAANQSTVVKPNSPNTVFVPWSESMQHAFNLMIPDTFKTKGGMYQFGATDYRADLHISSPDNSITLIMGDSKLSPYAMPDPKLTKKGFKDEKYEVRSGVKMLVRPYQQAAPFLSEYGKDLFGRHYDNVHLDGVLNQPALASGISTIYQKGPAPAGNQEFTAAEAHFHLMNGSRPMIGYIILVVEAISGYGPGMWKVPYLWGYVAAPEKEQEAKQYLSQTINSLQMDAVWIDKTSNKNAVVGEIINQVQHTIATAVNASP